MEARRKAALKKRPINLNYKHYITANGFIFAFCAMTSSRLERKFGLPSQSAKPCDERSEEQERISLGEHCLEVSRLAAIRNSPSSPPSRSTPS